jgi:uncharacterized protein (TIGR00730 family)
MPSLCVFCGSSPGRDPAYSAAARELGTLLAQRGTTIVYGGGNVGLMGLVADAALAANGEVVGVIPRALVDREVAHRRLTKLHVVDTMHERKQLMHQLSDGFIVLPGGIGTLDELFETLTWALLGVHGKPCGLLDVAGFWQPLLQLLEHQTSQGFVRPHHSRLLLHATSATELLTRFATYVPPEVPKWLNRDQS